ncbi:MAG: antitoxin Xre/MbcA/ParS toxin-binding domain-containing protein [Pseudomonadota bacterium]
MSASTLKQTRSKSASAGKRATASLSSRKSSSVLGPEPAQRALRNAAADKGKVGSLLFEQIVTGKPLAGFDAIATIREGYAASMLKAASSYFNLPDVRIQTIVGIPASTASRLEKKSARIDSGATERIYRMGAVTRMAIEVFENEDAAIDWMRQPSRVFGDVAPLDLMDTEPGAVSVRQVLNAIATGGVA